jgi:hypothetical protein
VEEKYLLDGPGVDRREPPTNRSSKIGWACMDCIHQAYDKDKWRLLEKWQGSFGFHKILGNSWLAGEHLTS